MTIGKNLYVLSAGDVCRIEVGVEHGQTRALGNKDAVLIDIFEPIREEHLRSAREREQNHD